MSTPRRVVFRTGLVRLVACLAMVVVWPVAAPAQHPTVYTRGDLKSLERAFTKLADDVRPSVVAIRTYELGDAELRDGTRVKIAMSSQGSGFIIDADGYIVTNRHVIEDAGSISVTLHNGLIYNDVELVEANDLADLAVLKIDAPGLHPIRWGDGAKLKVNQWAFACGNPFGLANYGGRPSVTFGVVSALRRNLRFRLTHGIASELHAYANLIETSAAINPGSSGGPLFDIDGKVIGIVTAIETTSGVNEGLGFAIPVDTRMRGIIDRLKAGEEIRYGFLGVQVDAVGGERARRGAARAPYRGAVITRISVAEGPAAKAQLRPNDVVIEFDGVPVEDPDDLIRLVGFTPAGTRATVTFLRRGVKHETVVTLGDRDKLFPFADRDIE
ncbi:MAG: S1C family serine protease [Phycisphaerae bacterium]